MKTKWTTICANFSEDEVKIIDVVCSGLNTTRSKLLRSSLTTSVVAIAWQALVTDKNSPLVKLLVPEMKKMFNPEWQKKLDDAINRIQNEHPILKKKAQEEAKIVDEATRPFVSHNKRGAPKQKPGKRGKPKLYE